MFSQIDPRLRRSDVMFNSVASSISNTPKELSWTPEMPFSEIPSQPIMSLQKFESGIASEQLKGFTNTYSSWYLDRQVDVINSYMQFIDSKTMPLSNFSDKELAIFSNVFKFKWIPSILGLPKKMESILPGGVSSTFQVHFFASTNSAKASVHAQFAKYNSGAQQSIGYINNLRELNIKDGNSFLCSKAEVSLPLM